MQVRPEDASKELDLVEKEFSSMPAPPKLPAKANPNITCLQARGIQNSLRYPLGTVSDISSELLSPTQISVPSSESKNYSIIQIPSHTTPSKPSNAKK